MDALRPIFKRLGRKGGGLRVLKNLPPYEKMLALAEDPASRKTLEERLLVHIVKGLSDDDCWGWSGSTVQGYGRINICGDIWLAHRVSFWIYLGMLPQNRHALHSCDNPPCCNPRHLFIGTDLDNQKDCYSKGRHLFGERCLHSKLTEDQVVDIKSKYIPRVYSQFRLASEFGVSRSAIEQIVCGRNWKHLSLKHDQPA